MRSEDDSCDSLVSAVLTEHSRQHFVLRSNISNELARQKAAIDAKIARRQGLPDSPVSDPPTRTGTLSTTSSLARRVRTPPLSMRGCLSVSPREATLDVEGVMLNLEIRIVRSLDAGTPVETVVFADELVFAIEDVLALLHARLNLPGLSPSNYQLRTLPGLAIRRLPALVHGETYLLSASMDTGSSESIASLINDDHHSAVQVEQPELTAADIFHALLLDEIEDIVTDVIFHLHAAVRTLMTQACSLHQTRHTPLRFTYEFDKHIDTIHDLMGESHSSGEMDALIRRRFSSAVTAAALGQLGHWESGPRGLFALVMLLDQFPRRIYRGTAEAFRGESMLFEILTAAVPLRVYAELSVSHRVLVCLALSRVENLAALRLCLALWTELEPELAADVVERVSAAIRRNRATLEAFGRFPDRNAVLRRQSTPAEIAHLARGGLDVEAPGIGTRLSVSDLPRRSTIGQTVAKLSRRFSRRS